MQFLMQSLKELMHVLMRYLTHHYIANIVGGLYQEGDWNDDRQTRGCVTVL